MGFLPGRTISSHHHRQYIPSCHPGSRASPVRASDSSVVVAPPPRAHPPKTARTHRSIDASPHSPSGSPVARPQHRTPRAAHPTPVARPYRCTANYHRCNPLSPTQSPTIDITNHTDLTAATRPPRSGLASRAQRSGEPLVPPSGISSPRIATRPAANSRARSCRRARRQGLH